jgi:pyrimidine operon attenuation protein / uracil phosphoribosyltransferase
MHETLILSPEAVADTLRRLADAIHAAHPGTPLAFVGIHTRGVVLADRLVTALRTRRNDILQGTLDISLYRDDLNNLAALPSIEGSDIPFDVEGATIILCDDVLFTGRTIRAAMNVLLDYGRPARIQLAVLADRGHRELPIAPTWTGIHVPTQPADYLRVHFRETDGDDNVIHYTRTPA